MHGKPYKFGDHNGAFMGAHFEYEHELQNSKNIARNVVAAILHIAHSKKHISYSKGIQINDFWETNREFMNRFTVKFQQVRNYELSYSILRDGMTDFLERMKWIEEN